MANLRIPATSTATSFYRLPSFQIGRNQSFYVETFCGAPTAGSGNPPAIALLNPVSENNVNVLGNLGVTPRNITWYVDVPNRASYAWDMDTGDWIDGTTGQTNANINEGNTEAIFAWALDQNDWYVVMPDGNQGGVNTSDNTFNFGQQGFQSPTAEGFIALHTQNLPEATIRNGRDHFRAITGPGEGAGFAYGNNDISFGAGTAEARFDPNDSGTFTSGPVVFPSSTDNVPPGAIRTHTLDFLAPRSSVELTCQSGDVLQLRVWLSIDGITWRDQGTITDWTRTITFDDGDDFRFFRSSRADLLDDGYGLFVSAVDGNSGILDLAQGVFDNGLYIIKSRTSAEQWQFFDTINGETSVSAVHPPTLRQITTLNQAVQL